MNIIISKIGIPATLEQLAEEADELGHAALKLSRVIRGENPTPVGYSQAVDSLLEEVADVRNCLNALVDAFPGLVNTEKVESIKMNRWFDRLNKSNMEG